MARIYVRSATFSDVPRMEQVREQAFASGPIARTLFKQDLQQENTAVRLKEMQDEMEDPNSKFLVACLGPAPSISSSAAPESVDATTIPSGAPAPTAPGTVVGYVKWVEYLEERPASEWDTAQVFTAEMVGPAVNLEPFNEFFQGLKGMRSKWIGGKPHLLLSMLVTSPDHQRIGAGSALITKVFERLDTLNEMRQSSGSPQPVLDCFIEASPPGYPLYYKLGFRDQDVIDVDLVGKYGLQLTAEEQKDRKSWGAEYGRDVGGDLKEGWFRTTFMVRKGRQS